jgi:hypothetical protein
VLGEVQPRLFRVPRRVLHTGDIPSVALLPPIWITRR